MSALITAVFDEFVGCEYSQEGTQTFYNFTTPQAIQERYAGCTARNPELSCFTVNASPYSENIYQRLGFAPRAELTEKDGIKYIPMEMKIPPRE
ncbi:MAG: GNAT family N-acetyltransferase [Spirochaetota bacterium]